MSPRSTCVCGKTLRVDGSHPNETALCPACGNMATDAATAVQTEKPSPRIAVKLMPTQRAIDLAPVIDISKRNVVCGWLKASIITMCIVMYGLILGMGEYLSIRSGDGTQSDTARAQVKGPLTTACQTYLQHHGRWPDSLTVLSFRNANGALYLESPDGLIDPWGSPYKYDRNGPRNHGRKPDIWTVDPHDGTLIGNWPKSG